MGMNVYEAPVTDENYPTSDSQKQAARMQIAAFYASSPALAHLTHAERVEYARRALKMAGLN